MQSQRTIFMKDRSLFLILFLSSMITTTTTSLSSTEFALNLYRSSSDSSSNFVISPFSFGSSIAILNEGAKGITQDELTKIYGINATQSDISSLYSDQTKSLEDKKDNGVVVSVANRFYVDKNLTLIPEYNARIRNKFNVVIESIDFKDGDAAAKKVNDFANKETRGMIPSIVVPESFKNVTSTIVNAVYFNGIWNTQFNKNLTKDRDFHGIKGIRKTLFMNYRGEALLYSQSINLSIVSIPYKDGDYSMVVMMPTGHFDSFKQGLTHESFKKSINSLKKEALNVALPKFKIESTTNGVETLNKMGVNIVFSDESNLSGISNNPLKVSQILHKSVIEVKEEGTKAAAATVINTVHITSSALPRERISIVFDRPFIYAIFKGLKEIVFIGQYVV